MPAPIALRADEQGALKRPPRWFAAVFFVFTALLLVPYGERLVSVWLTSASGSAASIVALVAAVWVGYHQAHHGWPPPRRAHAPLALLTLGLALLAYLLGVAISSQTGALLGGSAVILTLTWLTQGTARLWHLRHAAALLLLATPVPPSVALAVQARLVALAASINHGILDPLVGPVVRRGAVLEFPNGTSVRIIQDCSGLEGIAMLIPTAAILAYLYRPLRAAAWPVLLVSPILFGLVGNLVRVLLATAGVYLGTDALTEGIGHELLGLGTIAGSFLLQWVTIRAFRRR